MIHHFGKFLSLALVAFASLGTQSALAWDTSPSSGSSYSWNSWGSNLEILFEGSFVDQIRTLYPSRSLQVDFFDEGDTTPSEAYCSSTPCLWVHGLAPACLDENLNAYCDGETVVVADLNISIDPVSVVDNVFTAGGKKTHIDGSIRCESVLYSPTGATCATAGGFPAAVGLPKAGNFNKIFPAESVEVQGETVYLDAGQLLWLAGPLNEPKGPVLRHCYEPGKDPGTGEVDCGNPQNQRTAQAELPPFIGGLLFESTTTNLNIGKNSTSFAIHVNLLSQTNDKGLTFVPEQIDFSDPPAIGGVCEPILGQMTWNDYNNDGVTDVRLKYDAGCVAELPEVTITTDGQPVSLAVRGILTDGIQFEGTFDVIVNQ